MPTSPLIFARDFGRYNKPPSPNFRKRSSMDTRRLIFGMAVLLLAVGFALAAFTPGGWFNRGASETFNTPFGSVTVTDEKSSAGPIIGYVLLGLGGVGLVTAFAMKSPPPHL